MRILVIDGQGGGLGKQLVTAIKAAFPHEKITAVGTNSAAANVMLKAGADSVATGENAVIVHCRKADLIVGPIGIVIADSLLGEVTPRMAMAAGQSDAKRVLIPVSHCNTFVAGVPELPVSRLIQDAVEQIRALVT